ncbi:MAG: inverse autotransporter beta domain-containing protein [Magnetovibrionaceae bacterium]
MTFLRSFCSGVGLAALVSVWATLPLQAFEETDLPFGGGTNALTQTREQARTVTASEEEKSRYLTFGQGVMQAGRYAVQDQKEAALFALTESSIDFLLPGLGEQLPEWARHIEFEWEVQNNRKPGWSVLGVFPLFETEDLQDTVFTQISQRRYDLLGVDRDVTNLGLGYRRLLFNNAVLVGVNGFFDYEWKYHHQRVSAGTEVKWAGLDFNSNFYWRATGKHSAGAGNHEDVLDGHDIELTAQVPFVPWARISGRRYWWKTNASNEDIKGWETRAEMDIHQNLQVEAGVVSDNTINDNDDNEAFAKVRMTMDLGRPVALSSEWVSSSPWLMRDMTEYRLEKVRRENKIIVERTSSGVVISRGN